MEDLMMVNSLKKMRAGVWTGMRNAVMISAWAFAPAILAAPSSTLTLDAYLDQVRGGNKAAQAAAELSAAGGLKAAERSVILSPNLYATWMVSRDHKPTSNPVMMGSATNVDSIAYGVSQLTPFGLAGKLSMTTNHIVIEGASPQFLPLADYYETRPQLEISQSLWKNGFGRETRAQLAAVEGQALLSKHSERLKEKFLMAEAEGTYWRLALAREAVAAQKESYARAVKMREWSAGRVKLSLADKADLLQSEAAVKGRELEMQAAVDEEQAASRQFNSLRGMASDKVTEALGKLTAEAIDKMADPSRSGPREDVLVARQAETLAKAAATIAREKYAPQVDLFASIAGNGRDAEAGQSKSEGMDIKNPTRQYGVKLNIPLGVPAVMDQRRGAEMEARASELTRERKEFEEEREWEALKDALADARKRLDLAAKMEEIQKDKYEHEKGRQSKGRSTLFQVLMFEQDYAAAQLNRIRMKADFRRIVAQMKTFGGN
jgi:outer membrane protein TolC